MPPRPTGTVAHVQVRVDNGSTFAQSFAGGYGKAEVITMPMGPGKLPVKSISTLSFSEMSLALGMSMGQPIVDWINLFMHNTHPQKSGVVAFADVNLEVASYLDFRDALITEIGMPALDASSKDAAFFTIVMQPEETRRRKGDKEKLSRDIKQKPFLASNFRVRIGDLPTGRVTKVDAMKFQMKVQENTGRRKFAELVPTIVEMPILKLTITALDAPKWEQWFDDFVILGNNGSGNELSGVVEYLAANGKDVLATLELEHIGIFELASGEFGAQKDLVASFTASMYFESATFKIASS